MSDVCTKCGAEARQGTTKYGANCWREYRANRKVASKPPDGLRERGEANPRDGVRLLAVPTDPRPDSTSAPVVTSTAGAEIDPETGEVLDDRLDPRVHQEGWRGLPEGRGGIGWQPSHGPDSGRLCCKHLTCYDALRPMAALTKGVQPGEAGHPRWCWCGGCRPHLIGRSVAKAAAE